MAGYTPPVFRDWDPSNPVDAERLAQLGKQYDAVKDDIPNPATPVGAAVREVAISVGGGIAFVDNGDGTLTLAPSGAYVDNGDGTITIGA